MMSRLLHPSRQQHDQDLNRHASNSSEWFNNSRPRRMVGFERQTVSTLATSTEHQRQRVITLQVPSIIADGLEATRSLCWDCWQVGWGLTTAKIFPSKIVLYRVSVMAIAWERVLEDLCWEITQGHGSCLSPFASSATSAPLTLTPNWSELNWSNLADNNKFIAVQYLSWCLPLVLLVICISQHQLVSTTSLLWPGVSNHSPPDEVFLVAALVSLLFLEALFPLTILACTSLFLLQKLSCATSLAILGGVYVMSSTTAGWIRCILYSYIGGRE